MKKKLSRTQAKQEIEQFFADIYSKTPREVKKIKKLAMSHKIPLKENRKLFCKYCLNPYSDPSIRVKGGLIKIECGNCKKISRWKIK